MQENSSLYVRISISVFDCRADIFEMKVKVFSDAPNKVQGVVYAISQIKME